MKRNDLLKIKKLDQKALIDKVRSLQGEIADLIVDKNMSKLKDVKAGYKKRKDLAQVLTVLRQKQLLKELESRVESPVEDEAAIGGKNLVKRKLKLPTKLRLAKGGKNQKAKLQLKSQK